MNISHINFLGFFGGFAPLPPRRRGTKARDVDKYPLYAGKKPGAAAVRDKRSVDISERFLLGGVPVVAPPAHFFRAFGALKNQRKSTAKPKYAETRP